MDIVSKKAITDPNLKWFRAARFGMFVHFGLYSIPARGEWLLDAEGHSRAQYERLMQRFNPRKFSADAWIDQAEEMGARYMTVTAKHHDGFCMYDSALTDYKITNTPFGRDLIGELVERCHRRNMPIVIYYSLLDWHHPHYDHERFGTHPEAGAGRQPNWPEYLDYYIAQVRELCVKYGHIDGFWFDGGARGLESDWRRGEVYRMIKRYHPRAVVNDRGGRGDYYSPERSLPDDLWGYHFETCQALGMEWGYIADCDLYSASYLIRSLAHCAGHGGNFLLNFGPLADGTLPADRVRLARCVARWAKRNAAAIYGTEGFRLLPHPKANNRLFARIYATRRGKNLYLLLPEWPMCNRLLVPGLHALPKRAVLTGHQPALSVRTSAEGILICNLPPEPPQQGVNVIALSFATTPQPPHPLPVYVHVTEVKPEITTLFTPEIGVISGRTTKGHKLRIRPEQNGFVVDYPAPGQDVRGVLVDWTNTAQNIRWRVRCKASASFFVDVELRCTKRNAGSEYVVQAAGRALAATVKATPPFAPGTKVSSYPWSAGNRFQWQTAGRLRLPSGAQIINLQPTRMARAGLFADVRALRLRPAGR